MFFRRGDRRNLAYACCVCKQRDMRLSYHRGKACTPGLVTLVFALHHRRICFLDSAFAAFATNASNDKPNVIICVTVATPSGGSTYWEFVGLWRFQSRAALGLIFELTCLKSTRLQWAVLVLNSSCIYSIVLTTRAGK